MDCQLNVNGFSNNKRLQNEKINKWLFKFKKGCKIHLYS